MALDRLLDLLAHRFLCFSSIFTVLVIPICVRQSWPAHRSTFGRTIIRYLIDWLIDLKNKKVKNIKQKYSVTCRNAVMSKTEHDRFSCCSRSSKLPLGIVGTIRYVQAEERYRYAYAYQQSISCLCNACLCPRCNGPVAATRQTRCSHNNTRRVVVTIPHVPVCRQPSDRRHCTRPLRCFISSGYVITIRYQYRRKPHQTDVIKVHITFFRLKKV